MNHCLVSVVVPIYNVEKYLDRCVDSIVNQTYQNLEIILVDDGSSDNCPQMCDEWAKKDKRIHVIHKENQGAGMARNTGIDAAKGSYICFIDSDDYVSPFIIEKAYNLASKDCSDIVTFGTTIVNKNGKIVKEVVPKVEKCLFEGEEVHNQFLPDLIDDNRIGGKNKNVNLCIRACLFSMKLIQCAKWRIASEREVFSEDVYSILDIYKYVNSVSVLSEALYFYCENSSSLTQSYWADKSNKIRFFYYKCLEIAEKHGYCSHVKNALDEPYVSFSIAALKQEVARYNRHLAIPRLHEIIDDEGFQQVLSRKKNDRSSVARRVIIFAMRNRMYNLCYWLLLGKHMSESKWFRE